MKKAHAIVHIGRNLARPGRFVRYIYRDGACVYLGGQMPGGVTGDAELDYENLTAGHHGSGRLLRSLVVSLDCPTTDESVQLHSEALGQCAGDFRNRFAPGSPYLFAVHRQGKKVHAHVLVLNSDGDRCLEWGPKRLREMQDFDWTVTFETGRGKGKNQFVGKTAYPGRKTVAAQLAGLALDEIADMLDAGDLGVTRTRKDGSPLTLELQGRKIRVQSVCAVDPEFLSRLTEAQKGDDDSAYILSRLRQKSQVKTQPERNRGRGRY